MSQPAVEKAIGKLATDEAFRDAFFADPGRALLEAGLSLSPCELSALRSIPTQALRRFGAALDDRICRLKPLPADGQEQAR
jgi:putative modified peptide